MDSSSEVVAQMQRRTGTTEERKRAMRWFTCDVTQLDSEFEPGSFDVIIDKACLDAVLCGPQSFKRGRGFVKQIYNVLKPGGRFFSVSHAPKAARLTYLNRASMPFEINTVELREFCRKPLCCPSRCWFELGCYGLS